MKIKYVTLLFFSSTLMVDFADAGGKTGACTPPTGGILADPIEYCGDTGFAVSIGREVSLESVNPADKDCWCGKGIQDSIDSASGIKWTSDGGGEFDPADGIGDPVTWIAPGSPKDSVRIALLLDDKATATHTYDDGTFKEAGYRSIQVYIPNTMTWTTTPVTHSCPAEHVGQEKHLKDTVSNTECSSLDFSGLDYTENEASFTFVVNGCNLDTPGTGGAIATILEGNTTNGYDMVRYCSKPANPPDPMKPGTFNPLCRTVMTTDWRVRKTTGPLPDRVWHVVNTREYEIYNPELAYIEADRLTSKERLAPE